MSDNDEKCDGIAPNPNPVPKIDTQLRLYDGKDCQNELRALGEPKEFPPTQPIGDGQLWNELDNKISSVRVPVGLEIEIFIDNGHMKNSSEVSSQVITGPSGCVNLNEFVDNEGSAIDITNETLLTDFDEPMPKLKSSDAGDTSSSAAHF